MKEKRRHVTKNKIGLFLILVAVLTMLFSPTVLADNDENRNVPKEAYEPKKYDLDEIESSSDPFFLVAGNIIHHNYYDKDEKNGLRVRYEWSESSRDIFPGSKAFYLGNTHEVHSYELNGVTYSMWRVKGVNTDEGYINLVLIPANNDSSNYVGYFHNWTLDSEEPCRITIKNTVEPEACFDNFLNGTHRVYIDQGAYNEIRLKYEEDFDAYYGSTVLEIDRVIIHSLSEGNHSITVSFADGSCKINFVKGLGEAHASGSQPSNAIAQTSQQATTQTTTQNGVKKAPKTGEI